MIACIPSYEHYIWGLCYEYGYRDCMVSDTSNEMAAWCWEVLVAGNHCTALYSSDKWS